MTVFINFKTEIENAGKRKLKELEDHIKRTSLLREDQKKWLLSRAIVREQLLWFEALPTRAEPENMPYVHFGLVPDRYQMKMKGCINNKCKYCL